MRERTQGLVRESDTETDTETEAERKRKRQPEKEIDYGPEWRYFDEEDRIRVGSPRTVRRHDYGLGTEIPRGRTDSFQLRRMRKIHSGCKFETKKEQFAADGLTDLQRICGQLDLPDSIVDRACVVFREAHDADLAKGRSIDVVVGAAVLASAREQSIPVTAAQVAAYLPEAVETRHVLYVLRDVESVAGATSLPPMADELVGRIASDLDLSTSERTSAEHLARAAIDDGYAVGMKPSAIAAAAIYTVASGVTQTAIADAAGTSGASIRKHHREIVDLDAHPIEVREVA